MEQKKVCYNIEDMLSEEEAEGYREAFQCFMHTTASATSQTIDMKIVNKVYSIDIKIFPSNLEL